MPGPMPLLISEHPTLQLTLDSQPIPLPRRYGGRREYRMNSLSCRSSRGSNNGKNLCTLPCHSAVDVMLFQSVACRCQNGMEEIALSICWNLVLNAYLAQSAFRPRARLGSNNSSRPQAIACHISRLALRLTGSNHIPIDTSCAQGPEDTGRP